MVRLNTYKKKISIISALGAVSVLVALWFVLFGAPSLINKEHVEALLQQLSAQLAEQAKDAGKEGKLTYGETSIEGWGYNKRAVVHDVSFELSEQGATGPRTVTFSTPEVAFALDQSNSERVLMDFAAPVNVTENNQLKEVANFATPLRVGYLDSNAGGVHTFHEDLTLPKQITLSEPSADGKEPPKPVTMITYNDSSAISLVFTPEKKSRTLDYQFGNLDVSGANGNKVTVATLSSHYSEAPGDDGKVLGKYSFSADNIVLQDNDKASKPYRVNIDLDIASDDTALGLAAGVPHLAKGELTVNEALFASDEFKVRATGKLTSSPDDTLMFGDGSVAIENLPALLASELVSASLRPTVQAALAKIAGKDVSAEKDLAIVLKREKAGVFYIGQSNFQELATIVFAGLLTQAPAAAAPAAGSPAPAPADAAAPVVAAPAPVPTPAPTPAPKP